MIRLVFSLPVQFLGGADHFSLGPEQFLEEPDHFSLGPEQFFAGPDHFPLGPEQFTLLKYTNGKTVNFIAKRP
ncbi:hypothetical protein [Lysinibacillus sp. Bpr_S20]|uniref:hypothetical protein n=1 Tax=Lysinibacillus sp. Bpr_S20 TaxID=2933964 RepID=UPI0020126690|nr:hypothetical protein [Lysinibacillus sp. Bpr_S20]MCL1699499.1 hypothetical protein [Lysinibacillus sp. Bpr_S20]